MPPVPVMTRALARRIQQVIASLNIAGMAQVRDLPANPCGVQVERFGSATALLAVAVPTGSVGAGWWNRVVELDDSADETDLDALLALYRTAGLRCTIDLTPATLSLVLAMHLAARGVCAVETGAVSYGLPTLPAAVAAAPLAAGAVVREVGKGEVELVATLWADGFDMGAGEGRESGMRLRSGWFRVPENRLYVAYVGEQPAAMAALYVRDGIGFLNVGATLPAYRTHGLHTALTAQRIADAAQAGCELVIGETGFGTTSHRHMQHCGMVLAYNDLIWRDQEGMRA
jgi:Acetyltransferase (GNAT) domain